MHLRLFTQSHLIVALAVIASRGDPARRRPNDLRTAPAPRLSAGQSARVTVSDGTGNNLRAAASAAETSTVLGVMPDGEIVSVIGGPQCADNFWWWQIRRWDGQTGWTAEGVTGDYWLEPWPASGAALATGPRPALDNVLIAYLSGAQTGDTLLPYVMGVGSGAVTSLGSTEAADGALAWSPDGTRVAFSNGADVVVASADGQMLANLTNLPDTSERRSGRRRDGIARSEDPNPEVYHDVRAWCRSPDGNLPTSTRRVADGTRIACLRLGRQHGVSAQSGGRNLPSDHDDADESALACRRRAAIAYIAAEDARRSVRPQDGTRALTSQDVSPGGR